MRDGKIINKWSFLERNRLVSGVADAVLITEAAARSGTLNTASHALNQGRELFISVSNHKLSFVQYKKYISRCKRK